MKLDSVVENSSLLEPCDPNHSPGYQPDRKNTENQPFGLVWELHSAEVRKYCLRLMGGDHSDAEEAFSRTALRAFKYYREILEPRAWFFKAAHNSCIDIYRERKRRAEESLTNVELVVIPQEAWGGGSSPGDPERDLLQRELESFVEHWVEGLPDPLLQVYQRRAAGLEDPHIAAQLGISQTNVRKRAQLARNRLRQNFQAYSRNTLVREIPKAAEEPAGRDSQKQLGR